MAGFLVLQGDTFSLIKHMEPSSWWRQGWELDSNLLLLYRIVPGSGWHRRNASRPPMCTWAITDH